jgi:succinate dehydrogenase/fumarate reductase flavoprotein subunit
MIRRGMPCEVCGGTLTLRDGRRRAYSGAGLDDAGPRASAELRLLDVLRGADGQPVLPRALVQAGIDDPAEAIYELERAGHLIERSYSSVATGQRRFLGYRLWRSTDRARAGPA